MAIVRAVLMVALVALGIAYGNAGTAGAQMVSLQVRPHAGDTVRLQLDQRTSMEATRRSADDERTMTMVTEITVHTTAMVLKSEPEGATVSAITDSAEVSMEPDEGGREANRLRRRLRGQRVLMHIAPNGRASVMQSGGLPAPELSSLFSRMPALFPPEPVQVGGSWLQTIPVPVAGQAEGPAAMLRATFTLDSISDNGDLAFITIAGTLARSPVAAAQSLASGVTVETTGSISGSATLNRRSGWLVHAAAFATTVSTYSPPAGSTASPMTVTTHASQALRQVDN
ncbi:MAG TPA: DUF6263 family protein [Gemmatimonadales bacterium]|nr:DUF6263 family protein [Gemmatimonadales bacterium]